MNLSNKDSGVPTVREWWQKLADGNFPQWVEIEGSGCGAEIA